METILILGGFGFIGTNIIKYIDSHYSNTYRIIVFDRVAQHPHGIKFCSVCKTYSGDFSDETSINRIFDENKIDYVIHLISATCPTNSSNPQYDIEANLIPTIKLLQLMVKYSVKHIIFISSGGAIYGDTAENTCHTENDATFPISSYGIIKLTIEKYIILFSKINNMIPLILRLSNPYGPYHYSDKQGIVNVALRHAINNKPIQIWGDGSAEKDYIYIRFRKDTVNANATQTQKYNI